MYVHAHDVYTHVHAFIPRGRKYYFIPLGMRNDSCSIHVLWRCTSRCAWQAELSSLVRIRLVGLNTLLNYTYGSQNVAHDTAGDVCKLSQHSSNWKLPTTKVLFLLRVALISIIAVMRKNSHELDVYSVHQVQYYTSDCILRVTWLGALAGIMTTGMKIFLLPCVNY